MSAENKKPGIQLDDIEPTRDAKGGGLTKDTNSTKQSSAFSESGTGDKKPLSKTKNNWLFEGCYKHQ